MVGLAHLATTDASEVSRWTQYANPSPQRTKPIWPTHRHQTSARPHHLEMKYDSKNSRIVPG
jgi:hypothetical protein